MKPYIKYNDIFDPDANSYQGKLARKSKALISKERQGHLNRMKKSYKSGYQEKELTVPLVKIPCPESFIQGPDTLDIGEPGIFFSRANKSFNSFDIQSVWEVSTPANMNYDQRIIDSIPPYTGKEVSPKRYAKSSDKRKWSTDGLAPTKRWSSGGDDKKWNTDSGKKRWEGQQELADDTGDEEGFCRAEFKFNKSGMVRLDSIPILPGVSPLLRSAPKYVMIEGATYSTCEYYSDNFDDSYIDPLKWYVSPGFPAPPVPSECFDYAEQSGEMQYDYQTGTSGCVGGTCDVTHLDCYQRNLCPKECFIDNTLWEVSVDFSLGNVNTWGA